MMMKTCNHVRRQALEAAAKALEPTFALEFTDAHRPAARERAMCAMRGRAARGTPHAWHAPGTQGRQGFAGQGAESSIEDIDDNLRLPSGRAFPRRNSFWYTFYT